MDFSACDPAVFPYGFAVSWVVEFLKRFPILKRYPKVLAMLLAFVIPLLLGQLASPPHAFPLSHIVACALLIFGTSIVAHEVVTEPVQRNVFNRRER